MVFRSLIACLLALPASAQILHLPLDGTTDDVSGNDNHATLSGGVFSGDCVSGSCVALDGSDDFLEVSSTQLDDLTSFTYNAWIEPSAHGAREVFSKSGSKRELRLDGDRLRGCVIASPNACSNSNETVPLGQWTMVTMTYGHPGPVRLHLNGIEVTYASQSSSQSGLSSDAPVALNIGRRSSGDRHFAGRIDEVRVYDRVLSAAEIAELFAGGDPTPPDPPTCGPSAEWPGQTWAVVPPEQRCLDPALLDAAIAFAQGNGGGSGIIVRGGVRVGGWGDPDVPYNSASAAKTGTTALAALLARGDGLFDDSTLAQPINPSVPSATVTLRQLLTMTSGLHHTRCNTFRAPQGTWAYSNCGMDYAAETIGMLVGDLESYLRARVYDRIGASVTWDRSPPEGDVGLNWSVSDAARLMLLFLRDGEWDGEQLVDPAELAAATEVANPDAPFDFPNDYIHNGQEPPTFYGSAFWLNPGPIMAGVPTDLAVAMGAFGCSDEFFAAYSRSFDIVVVRAGDSLRSKGCDALHYEGNEDFLGMVFAAVQDPLPPAALPVSSSLGLLAIAGTLLAAARRALTVRSR